MFFVNIIKLVSLFLCSWFHLPQLCFSLSSASPAHSPKDECPITQSTDTSKEEAVHDETKDHRESQEDKSELTQRKSVTGWSVDCTSLPGEKAVL